MRSRPLAIRQISALILVTLLGGFVPPAPVSAAKVVLQASASRQTTSLSDVLSARQDQSYTRAAILSTYLPLAMWDYVSPPSVEVVVNPGQSAVVGAPDGSVRATFSPTSVSHKTRVQYQPVERPLIITPSLAVGGPAFALSAWDEVSSESVTQFPHAITILPVTTDRPATSVVTPSITIAVRYTDADVWGLDLRTLALYTRSGADQLWERLPTAVYQDRMLLVAEVDHLSEFVPMARLATETPSASIKRLVLDPDDDDGFAIWPNVGEVREITYNMRLAEGVKQRLAVDGCQVDVVLTRDSVNQRFVSRTTRAATAQNLGADVFVTLAFNARNGKPWGVQQDGGPVGWARTGQTADVELVQEFYGRIPKYTGRQPRRPVQNSAFYPEFAGLSVNTYAHIETLFLDHNFDWEVIRDNTNGFPAIINASYSAIRTRLEAIGMQCLVPDGSGGFKVPPLPAPPSAEQLQQWRDLGYQNYQRYGADPVSFSTGNHVLQVPLFRIPNRGGLDLDFTLTYNAQDGRDDLFGYGWSFPFNARVQHYSDESISVVLHDGRTYHYTWDGSRYIAPPGVFDTLERSPEGWQWTTVDNELSLRFQETITGLGVLREMRDRRGNALHFEYDLSGQDNWKNGQLVPRPPLEVIRDDAGRTIDVVPNADGRVQELRLPDNRAFNFAYDNGNLVAITDAQTPVRGTRRFEYDERHRITKAWDVEDIFFLENIYDDRDRVVQQFDTDRVPSFLQYDPIGRTTTFIDNEGFAHTYNYDNLNRVTEATDPENQRVGTRYNADYTVSQSIDARGSATSYSYDANGNLRERRDPRPQNSCSATIYQEDLTTWQYNEFNQVVSMTNAIGHTWVYTYDDLGNLRYSQEPNSAVTEARYNTWGQPEAIIDALGRTTQYQYDKDGNLIHVIDAATKVTTSTYDIVGRELSYADANNHTVGFTYDGNDNIISIVDPKGHAATFSYDRNNLLRSSVDRRQTERSYQYDNDLKLIAERDYADAPWTRYGYDRLYRRTTMADTLGYETRYAYDQAGRLATVTDALGATTQYTYDASGNLVSVTDALGGQTTMAYDEVNRLASTTDAAGNQTAFCYDAEDRLTRTVGPRPNEVTSYTYDQLNRLERITDPLGNVTRYEHDRVGNRTGQVAPLGYRTDYSYDLLNRLVTVEQPVLTGGMRPMTRFGYDAVGNTLAVTSARGFATNFTYDKNDNLETITDPLGAQIAYTYDQEDNQLSATDPNGHITSTTYNPVGLPLSVKDGRGFTTRMAYDPAYNLVRLENAEGRPTVYEYDPMRRLARQTDSLGNPTVYKHDALGRVTATQDANSHTTGYSYDTLGRLLSVTDARNGKTSYAYDEASNLISIADANNHSTTFAYDLLNLLRAERNPLGNTWRYSYDPNRRLTQRVDALGRATSYEYDSNDRLLGIDYGAPQEQPPLRFDYDLDGNQTEMCDGLGCTSHTYDALGRNTSTTDWLDRTVRRKYDGTGNLLSLIYPNNRPVRYEYDAANALVGLTDPRGATSRYGRNPLGQVTQIAHPNGTASSYTYDTANRLAGIDNRRQGAAQPYSAYAYTLDKVGNRTRVVETRQAFDGSSTLMTLERNYGYDALDRLTQAATAQPTSDTTYNFDAVGNRLEQSGTALAPNPGLPKLPVAARPQQVATTYNEANQLLTASESAFGHDANGNRDTQTTVLSNGKTETTDYAFDREDRLVAATKRVDGRVTMEASYRYDGYGRRAIKTVRYSGKPIETTTYLYDGLDIIGAQLERGDKTNEIYYYLAPSPITGLRRPVEMEQLGSGTRYWYQADGLDSVVGLTDEDGDLVSPLLYGEYGQLLVGAADLQIFTYTAQDHDAETSLLHFYARYYDPATGTWLTQDTYRGQIDAPVTMHRYGYVKSSPINNLDVLGFWGWDAAKDWVREHKQTIAITAAVIVATGLTVATMGAGAPIAATIIGATLAGAAASGGATIAANGFTGENLGSNVVENTIAGGAIGFGIGGAAVNLAAIPRVLGSGVSAYSQLTASGTFASLATSYVGMSIAANPLIPQNIREKGTELASTAVFLAQGFGLANSLGNTRRTPQVLTNNAKGKAFEAELAKIAQQEGYTVRRNVSVWTPFGIRYQDLELTKNGKTFYVEAKTGNSPYSSGQRAKDAWIQIVGVEDENGLHHRYKTYVIREK